MRWRANSAEDAWLFERPHHRDIALVLQSLDASVLSRRHCYFGGGTALALRYGEYRESRDIDFVVSDLAGYRELRQMVGSAGGRLPFTREGLKVELARQVRTDQYGIRAQVRSGESAIKFEIVLEARIDLTLPEDDDASAESRPWLPSTWLRKSCSRTRIAGPMSRCTAAT